MVDPDEYLPNATFAWCKEMLASIRVHGTIKFRDRTAELDAVHMLAYCHLRSQLQLLHIEGAVLPLCTIPTGAYAWLPNNAYARREDHRHDITPIELEDDDREKEPLWDVDAVDQEVGHHDSSDTEGDDL